MLLFIRTKQTFWKENKTISIHLMLLFITTHYHFPIYIVKFQYISCYCLSLTAIPRMISSSISIHLMLLFIARADEKLREIMEFQYISCYCLSRRISCICILQWNFNTSHVTVYHPVYPEPDLSAEFQYISCYCLS